MSKKYKRVCGVLNYIDHFLVSTVSGWVFMSDFASLVGISLGIASSATGLKNSVIAAGIKMYKSIIKKKKKEHDKLLSLAKSKLNSI